MGQGEPGQWASAGILSEAARSSPVRARSAGLLRALHRVGRSRSAAVSGTSPTTSLVAKRTRLYRFTVKVTALLMPSTVPTVTLTLPCLALPGTRHLTQQRSQASQGW